MGYAKSNLIVIEVEGISRHHAVLIEDGDDLFLNDNGSLNGTYLNCRPVHDKQKIFSGDTIQLGIQQISVVFSSDRTVTLNFIPPVWEKTKTEGGSSRSVPSKEDGEARSPSGEQSGRPLAQEKENVASQPETMFVEGREIGKYIIEKRIGKGGMGEIYLAKHKTLGIYRALKVLCMDMRKDNSEFFERFIREAKLASEIRHNNVVGVIDVETNPSGLPYIVMEYVDGGSLRSSLNTNKKLSEEQAVVIVEAVASALQTAEMHSIVHRDIKPDNIMFTKQGDVKLADLGIAKKGDIDNDLTRTNMLIGTPAYLSPEQAQNAKHVDCRADIYSLGATFYEMLTGEIPYPGSNPYEIIHKLVADPVPDPRKINPEVSAASAMIVMKMLAKNAKDRFQNASELLEMMDRTFPPHTANETAELIKKVIAGECENNEAFSSEIVAPHNESRIRRFCKWICLAFLGIGCFINAFHFCTRIRPFEVRIPSTQERTDIPADEGTTEDTGDQDLPDKTASVQNESYALKIRTTPNSTVSLIFSDGSMKEYVSDHEGKLNIPGLQPGRYTVSISRNKYRPFSSSFDLNGDKEMDAPLAADLYKLVVKAEPNSTITISGIENGEMTVPVPPSGRAEIPGLWGETVLISVKLSGHETFEQSISLSKDTIIQAKQTKILTNLTVLTVPYANVVLTQDGGTEPSASVKADSSGKAEIPGISPGKYKVAVSCDGYLPWKEVRDFSKDMTLIPDLQKITHELQIWADADTQIKLFMDFRLQESYRVPSSGKLSLFLLPGKYSIEAEKNGNIVKSIGEFELNGFKSVDCRVPESETRVVGEAPDKEKTDSSPDSRQTAAAEPGKETDSAQPDEQDSLPEKRKVSVSCDASFDLQSFIQANGVEISIDAFGPWTVNTFPWISPVELEVGEHRIRIRGNGISEYAPQFKITTSSDVIKIMYAPEPEPARMQFNSNQPNAVISFNGVSYRPGNEVECEPFQDLTVTAVYNGIQKNKSIRILKPGSTYPVQFEFEGTEREHSMQKEYLEGKELFDNKKYKEALETLLPVAEADHMEAAKLVAEIYERGLTSILWFSDTSEALKWYRKAADLGDPESALKIAEAIEKKKLKESAGLMLNYYLKAKKLDRAEIYYTISKLYEGKEYKEIPQDDKEMLKYLKLAAEKGLPDAMFDLGLRYERGHGVATNSKLALEWINKAADAGHSQAKRHRGNLKRQ